ncbi:beta-lactamase-like protein [Dimargaris cristalligena]|uniref:Beta-lactamase-like protein n=1 Tax=Dimargaris cristalligena TaxID=215637 RepID=A0A4P9ZNJ4_9FUNG|nr:beta-lactamase-like protein [Dimargaris cristalligena]|eukprot:RKP34708.1 beta-lactamase-like protein [Dimargaris cristalligena]
MVCDLPLPTSFTSRPTVTQPSPTSASVHPPAYNYSTIVDYTLNLDIVHSEIPTKFSRAPRTCPFYKRMPHSNFAIDAFSYGRIPDCTGYFLTHFHADHYGGLTSTFNHGPIYCSAVTANLVIHKLGVNSQWVRVLPLNQPVLIGEARVTLFEANHCPGSVLFFFDIPLPSPATAARSFKILHTGDFRACPAQCLNPYIKDTQLDALYLDTTYLDPTYAFPPQREVIEAAPKHRLDDRLLFVVGTYTIGKERIFASIAEALDSKVYVDYPKKRILRCLEDPALWARLTDRAADAQVHVTAMNRITKLHMEAYLRENPAFTHLAAIKPTGWTFACRGLPRRRTFTMEHPTPISRSSNLLIMGVPYSEHSSFRELAAFVLSIQVKQIIPTVNVGDPARREEMRVWLDKWQAYKKHSGVQRIPVRQDYW